MIIIGGGYVAAEFAHVFSAFGTAVTVVNRSDLMLRHEDPDVAARVHRADRPRRSTCGWTPRSSGSSRCDGDGSRCSARRLRTAPTSGWTAEVLLVATGRVPNGDTLDLDARRGRDRRGRVRRRR